jgi:hypothetical protein
MVSLLYILFRLVGYSIFVAPFAILIIGTIFYYYKPIHRLTLGIILVALGSIGLLIYSVVFYLVLVNDSSLTGISLILLTICAEVLTLYIGIKSSMKRNVSLNLKFIS